MPANKKQMLQGLVKTRKHKKSSTKKPVKRTISVQILNEIAKQKDKQTKEQQFIEEMEFSRNNRGNCIYNYYHNDEPFFEDGRKFYNETVLNKWGDQAKKLLECIIHSIEIENVIEPIDGKLVDKFIENHKDFLKTLPSGISKLVIPSKNTVDIPVECQVE